MKFCEKSWNKKFVNSFIRKVSIMVWSCKKDITSILGRALELKFKGKKPVRCRRTRWFSHAIEDVKEGGKSWKEMEKERLLDDRRDRIPSVHWHVDM
jgi:hypothetical protein